MKTTHEPKDIHSNLMKIRNYFTQKSVLALIPLLACVLATGCASIVHGTTQKIKIDSTPSNSDVVIKQLNTVTETNIFEGKTPAVVKLSRKLSYLVTISHEGYHSIETPVEYKDMSGWIWGNIVFGGLIGCIIDGADGAASNLGPEEINVELVLSKASTLPKPAEPAKNEGGKVETNAVTNQVPETK